MTLGDDEYLIMTLPTPGWTLPAHLTEVERSITLAVLRGATNKQIASARRTSTRTIDNQIARIFAKVGVSSRIELAYRLGSRAADK